MIVAQQFTAGDKQQKDLQSVKRTAEPYGQIYLSQPSASRTGPLTPDDPSDESLGYFQAFAHAD
ncbi:MAG: hypothetical protein QOD75_2175 [Blastocatellia bacterium]|jgi:hypothetical protein|nr:hypothetical protein [Blastocatellia bacterium]